MTNYPGPYEVRINYSTVFSSLVIAHQHRFSLDFDTAGDPGDPFDMWLPQGRLTGFTDTLEDYVNDYIAVIQPFFATTTDFVSAELWEYAPGSFNAAFRSIMTLGVNGTSGSATFEDGQAIITFRSTLGGHLKMDFRRSVLTAGSFQLFPASLTVVNTYANFVVGNNTPIRARDNGFAFAPHKYLPGSNEKLFRNRLR